MAFNLHFSPFLNQHTAFIQQESATLNSPHLLAVHVLHFDDRKILTEYFIRIRQQIEWKSLFDFKAFMGFNAISGYTQYDGIQIIKLGYMVLKACPSSVQPGVLSLG